MDSNTATILSGVLSAVGGIIGAGGAYLAARFQTKRMIEHDRDTRIRQRNVEKLEEIRSAVVTSQLQLQAAYNSIDDQVKMINIVIEKQFNVFQKQNFINSKIEDTLIKGILVLQNLRILIRNNQDVLPVRIDDLEFLSALRKMEDKLTDFHDIKDLMIKNNKMPLDEFSKYFNDLIESYNVAKASMETYVFTPSKHFSTEINDNL